MAIEIETARYSVFDALSEEVNGVTALTESGKVLRRFVQLQNNIDRAKTGTLFAMSKEYKKGVEAEAFELREQIDDLPDEALLPAFIEGMKEIFTIEGFPVHRINEEYVPYEGEVVDIKSMIND